MGPKALKRKAPDSNEVPVDAKLSDPGGAVLPPTEITSFRGDYNFLSNFFHSPIVYDGLEFPTVEHAFQAAKCIDQASKLKLLNCNSPTIAKRVGRTVSLRPDWERVKKDIMHDILFLKFAPNSQLGNSLLATGDAELIEGNMWHDNVWGSCMCPKHKNIPGQNELGKLIMRVREELRSGGNPSSASNLS